MFQLPSHHSPHQAKAKNQMNFQEELLDFSLRRVFASTLKNPQVLDPKERPIRTLTPEKDDKPFIQGDPTAQVKILQGVNDICFDNRCQYIGHQ